MLAICWGVRSGGAGDAYLYLIVDSEAALLPLRQSRMLKLTVTLLHDVQASLL